MKEPPKARFVPPPDPPEVIYPLIRGEDGRLTVRVDPPEPLPLPEVTLGVWGGDEPRARLPADTSYLNPHGEDWRERQRAESRLIAVLAVIVTAGVVGWVCWVLTA